MGRTDGRPPRTTARLEGYLAALRLGGWPRERWEALTDAATMLHRYRNGQEMICWEEELGKPYGLVLPEDLRDAEG